MAVNENGEGCLTPLLALLLNNEGVTCLVAIAVCFAKSTFGTAV